MKEIIRKTWRCISCVILLPFLSHSSADSISIRVHFLHGSKPKREYRYVEDRWFGGILGGHAGIEYEPNHIINFQPKARFHIFSNPRLINSRFSVHDTVSFYEILGGHADSAKKTIITIRISSQQKLKLDSIVRAYSTRCPYDYAFFGMRCGAAAYEILSHTGVVRKLGFKKMWRKLFFPRRLRRRLEVLAEKQQGCIYKKEGSRRRIWERD